MKMGFVIFHIFIAASYPARFCWEHNGRKKKKNRSLVTSWYVFRDTLPIELFTAQNYMKVAYINGKLTEIIF